MSAPRDTRWLRSMATVSSATVATYAGTTTRTGHTAPETRPRLRNSVATAPTTMAIVTRRDDCQTTISALFSEAALAVCMDRPSERPIDASDGSAGGRRWPDGGSDGGADKWILGVEPIR